jgi:predicted GTPase
LAVNELIKYIDVSLINNRIMDKRKDRELTEEEIRALKREILKEVSSKPPTIGVIGVSGVGKSSTLNTLFKTNLATSDTVACTKIFQEEFLGLKFNKGPAKDENVSLVVIDAPGLGEDIFKDPEYLKDYKENLIKCDVILWIMTARNRAVALDQLYLQELSDFHSKMVFAINQVELIEPQDWNLKINLPMDNQSENIRIIEKDRKDKIETIVKKKIKICSYSAKVKYNLEELFGLLIDNCPKDRRWIFDGLKNFHYTDFLPEEIRKQLNLY